MTHAVILAGGWGERLWPLSNRTRPKQLLDLVGDGGTLVGATLERVSSLVSLPDSMVVTGASLEERVAEEVAAIPRRRVIGEPVGKNTAPAIALAAHLLMAEDPDAMMIVLPADHVIDNPGAFRRALSLAVTAAQREAGLVTLGITPTRPETEYGYIRAGRPSGTDGVLLVQSFEEKPDAATAGRYCEQGGYYWNSGMFVWRADRFLDEVRRWLPGIASALEAVTAGPGETGFREQLVSYYDAVPTVSVDYGVMEKAGRVFVVPAEFGWDDVGAWPALLRIWPKDDAGNAVRGDVILRDASDCVVC
ncbi:MAG: mannose-1-phosphate guanylyltransferase, partial [Candidatus Eisenbacteria bacterium]|nr:mannose-1-phosphate guanylyltransferase [Candidatus Eisenbacteria bacterium]